MVLPISRRVSVIVAIAIARAAIPVPIMMTIAVVVSRSLTVSLIVMTISGSAVTRRTVTGTHWPMITVLVDMGHTVLSLDNSAAILPVLVDKDCCVAVLNGMTKELAIRTVDRCGLS